jgi:glutathione S-transferase
MMKIYGYRESGNCDKVRFVADYVRRPYEWVEIDSVKGETKTAAFLAINPQGQVPVLELADGRRLAQSGAIMRFIAEGTPLLPDDKWLRAKIDEWMFWESNNHEFFVAGCIAHMTYLGKSKETRDPMRVERGNRALDILEGHLREADWVVGHGLTVADVALLAYTRQAPLGGFDMGPRPRTRAWVARCEQQLGIKPILQAQD